MARPSKLTPEVRRRIIDALKSGMTRTGAAGYARIHVTQLTRWCQRFANFATECAIAEQEAVSRFEAVIIKAAPNDPKAAIEWLKRRRRSEWGDTLDIRKLDDETLLRLLATEDGGVAPGTSLTQEEYFREAKADTPVEVMAPEELS